MTLPDNTSYWEATGLLSKYDLLVIGAGITGLSAALFYARKHPGAAICVLEKGYLPDGASTKNAGFACYGSVTETMDDLMRESVEEVRSRIARRYHGLELLKSELDEETIEFRHGKGYELFTDVALFESAREELPRLNEWVEAFSGQKNAFQTARVNGYDCIVNPMEGSLHSGKLIQALLKKVAGAGVEIRFNAGVEEVEDQQVKLAGGREVKAGKILLAVNGFTSELLPEVMIKPARGYVFVTGPLKDHRWKGTFHFDKGFIYFRNTGNRILLGGGRNRDFDAEHTAERGINPVIKNYLLDFAHRVLNLEKGWQIEYEWTGIMGFGQGKSPVINEIRPGIFVAAGFAGMGVALGMQAAKEVVDLMSRQ